MKIFNMLTSGEIGGIEVLCNNIGVESDYDNRFCFMTSTGLIYDRMKSNHLDVQDLTEEKKISLKKLFKLRELSKDYDIIVTHHCEIYLQLYYVLLKLCLPKRKYVMTFHSCYEGDDLGLDNPLKSFVHRFLLSAAIRMSDKIVYVSNAGKNSWEKRFKFACGKGTVIYNGIDKNKIEKGKKYHLPAMKNDHINILYVGRLTKIKGVHNLIKALAKLKDQYSFSLNIVGDGVERDYLEKLVRQLQIEDRIVFHGQVSDAASYFEKAHIFVYPSICEEVFGISIVEAMAYGLIVIAGRVGGIPEIVNEGVNGYLFEKDSSSDLERVLNIVIRQCLNKTNLEMSRAAKKTAEQFSVKTTISQLEELYTNLLRK